MASEFGNISDAILGELSQIGIEILNDSEDKNKKNSLPQAIYDATKDSSNGSKKKDDD
ncbi:hypothetical protein GF337_05480 [candidate division KSB1 bacterium]|nr:hypothetical protein [candidate division KSB1 bacterium]